MRRPVNSSRRRASDDRQGEHDQESFHYCHHHGKAHAMALVELKGHSMDAFHIAAAVKGKKYRVTVRPCR
jgi:hypothetical protein